MGLINSDTLCFKKNRTKKEPNFYIFFGIHYAVGDRDLKAQMKAFVSAKLYKNGSVSKHQEARDTELNFYTICKNVFKNPMHSKHKVFENFLNTLLRLYSQYRGNFCPC